MPEANPRAQHARIARRGGINSYLRGRGSRSERGRVCACVRARAPRSRSLGLPIQCHRHISTEPPPRPRPPPAAPATGSVRSRPRPAPGRAPPSLSRAPINQPRGCQSSGGSRARRRRGRVPLPLQLRAGPRALASPLRGSARSKQSAISFRGPGRGSERTGRGNGGVGVEPQLPTGLPRASAAALDGTSSHLLHLPGLLRGKPGIL